MRDRDTPLRLVRKWASMDPDCYDALDRGLSGKGTPGLEWPDYCVLPIACAGTYLSGILGEGTDYAMLSAELTACWLWRQQKIIYSFDADLARALADQADDLADTDVLPVEQIMHLPYPCIYVKAPQLIRGYDGFWSWIEYDMTRKAPELRIQWLMDDMEHTTPGYLHLLPGATLGDCIEDTRREIQRHLPHPIPAELLEIRTMTQAVLQSLQLVLYLSADNAEIRAQPAAPAKPRKISGKVIGIMDKAAEVQAFDVGIRIGAALRHARVSDPAPGDGGGSPKRSHTRRGHWHHYWTGPRDGDRQLILKWTAPTVIHPEDAPKGELVIYPVK